MLTPKENYMKVMRHETPEWLPNVLNDSNFIIPMAEIERYVGDETGYDGFGVHWTFVPDVRAPMPTLGMDIMDDVTKWREQVKFPDLDAYDWETEGADILEMCDEDKVTTALNINGMFERLHACMGMTEALTSLLLEPEACYEFFGAVADHKIGMVQRMKQYFKIDVVLMHDDYGTEQNLFMSLDTWRELLKPHLKRIIDACHECGVLYHHHSCGYIEPLVPDFVEIGMDALDTWQVCNKNMRAIKDEYQDRLAFIGGLDSFGILDNPDCGPDEYYAEFKRATDLMAPGGSYIPFPVTLTMDFAPTYFKFMNEYGTDFYKNHPDAVR